jgi:tRNA modification GTPase
MSEGDLIFALASGPLPSGIAVFRISGSDLSVLVKALLHKMPKPRTALLTEVHDFRDDKIIDRGLALWFPAPHSFTGEDCLELHLHGSKAVQLAMSECLNSWPQCRMAQAGEFTLRGLKNGKMSLMEVEAIADLLQAETEAQRFQAISAFDDQAELRVGEWRDALIKALAIIEASLDFSDEGDIPVRLLDDFYKAIADLQCNLMDASTKIQRAEIIKDGFKVALIGRPNAGKSSLLNHIAGRDVAIVSEYEGTTRDVIDVRVSLGGVSVVFTDTAGLRETSDPIEKIGLIRTHQQIEQAQLILWLDETGDFSGDFIPPDKRSIRIRTKTDLDNKSSEGDFAISAHRGDGVSSLLAHIESLAKELINPYQPLLFFNQRQNLQLQNSIQALERIKQLDVNLQAELIAEDLRLSLHSLEALIGRVDVEDVLGHIFSTFCIGK